MTARSPRVVASVFAVILALLAGAGVAFVAFPGPLGSPSPAVSLAVGSPTAGGSPSASASSSPSATASARPSATPTRPTPTPSPTPKPAPIAQLTVTQLKLDPLVPAGAGVPRFISFRNDGPGTITAQLKAISPQGTTHMCLRANSKLIKCVDTASGTITAHTTLTHVNWRVGLQGTDMFTPTVELTMTFPAFAPSVTITHARFDGAAYPDTNGIQVLFIPQIDGLARIVATWGGHPFLYEIDATNLSSGVGNKTLQGSTTNADASMHVTAAETWKLVLKNTESGFGPTDMTVKVSWP
jgi:hypothetical protein